MYDQDMSEAPSPTGRHGIHIDDIRNGTEQLVSCET